MTNRLLLMLLGATMLLSTSFAQDNPQSSKKNQYEIQSLGEEDVKKLIALNKDFVVYQPEVQANEKLPLLIYLHGGGFTKGSFERLAQRPAKHMKVHSSIGIRTIVVSPQSKSPWEEDDLNLLLAHLIEHLPVDTDRIYLTGNSMGGYGTYMWAATNPGLFAAIAPMVGGIGPGGAKDITKDLDAWGKNLATIPMRSYYGKKDKVVPYDRGEMIMASIKKAGGTKAELFIFEDRGHDAGAVPYSDVNFWKWLFSHSK